MLQADLATTSSSMADQSIEFGGALRYYIVRPNKAMVPLVPADELPFQPQGIPRQLSHQHLSKGRWVFVAETTEQASPLPLQYPAPYVSPSRSQFLAPDHRVKQEYSGTSPAFEFDTSIVESPTPILPTSSQSLPVRAQSMLNRAARPMVSMLDDTSKSLTESFASIYQKDAQRLGYASRTVPPSGIAPNPLKKEYCTYWIRTGECAFTAEGCKFKHDMPPLDKLREIGFTRIPSWWKEKSALRVTPWTQRRSNEANEEDNAHQGRTSTRGVIFRDILEQERREINREAFKGKSHHLSNEGRPAADDLASSGHAATTVIDLIDLGPPAPPPSPSSTYCTSTSASICESSASPTSLTEPREPEEALALAATFPVLVPVHDDTSPNLANGSSSVQPLRAESVGCDDLADTTGTKQVKTTKNASSKTSTKVTSKPSTQAVHPAATKKSGLAASKHATCGNEPGDTVAKTPLHRSRRSLRCDESPEKQASEIPRNARHKKKNMNHFKPNITTAVLG